MFRRAKQPIPPAYTPNNAVKLIRGGKEYFDLLEKMIRRAEHSIHIQVYIFEDDETGQRIASALKEAAQRGVRVFLLVDGYASNELSKEFINEIQGAGIHFRRFEPVLKSKRFYIGRRLHHKVVVIDAYYGLVGGLNISDRYNDTVKKKAWLDWALFAEGEVGQVLAKVCVRRFKSRIPSIHHEAHFKISATVKDCLVRVRINDWVNRKREITRSYLEMFATAESQIILMSPYFLPGDLFRKKIKQATARGVTIKVIQAGISDIALSKYAERYMYRWLLRNKVEIYEYQKTVLHGKIAVCDTKWISVGSYNLNNLSAYASVELNLDVANPAFARSVEHRLTQIIEEDCRKITDRSFTRHTGWGEQLLQRTAYDLLRIILFLFTFYFKQKE